VLYVLPFYLSKTTRPSPALSRDAPSAIRARIRAVTSACIAGSLLVILIITKFGHTTPKETLHLLGWWPASLLDVARTLLLCAVLFAGPLFEACVVEGRGLDWIRGTYIVETFSSWTGWRNLVAGPVTEEIVFRSLLVPIHLLANIPAQKIVFTTPLYFGIAHVHHLYEFRLTHPEVPLVPAVIRTIIQFGYTSLFGFFAAFVYLRTGSVYTAIAAHMFCNWMGLPRFWGRVGLETSLIVPPASKRSDGRTTEVNVRWSQRLNRLSTVLYYALLVGGSYGFYCYLFPLTESRYALVEFSKSNSK
jgi:prenyl protein peptidase